MFSANIVSNFVPEGNVISDAGGLKHPTLVMSLEQQVNGAREEYILSKNEEDDTIGLHSPMGNASSMKIKGKSPISCQFSSNHTLTPLSLSLIESSSNVLAQPTMEEVIAFGGIPKASTGVRSSCRLEGQHDANMPQMEKAMRQAQLREASCSSDKLQLQHSLS
jgi:hypothetical protein